MESLSPKQIREIKDLYKNVYKQEVVEEAGDFDDLFESEEFQSLSDELKENIVKNKIRRILLRFLFTLKL